MQTQQAETPNTPHEVYTVKEVADILRISTRGAYDYIKTTNDFTVFRIGKTLRISRDSFNNWLKGGA